MSETRNLLMSSKKNIKNARNWFLGNDEREFFVWLKYEPNESICSSCFDYIGLIMGVALLCTECWALSIWQLRHFIFLMSGCVKVNDWRAKLNFWQCVGSHGDRGNVFPFHLFIFFIGCFICCIVWGYECHFISHFVIFLSAILLHFLNLKDKRKNVRQ